MRSKMRGTRPGRRSWRCDLGRVLGLDPGERRIGVALSDPGRRIASPHAVFDRRDGDVAERLRSLCDEFEVETIVIGLPISLAGEEGKAAAAARRFGDKVVLPIGRNLVYWDERFTTVQAEQALLEAGMRRRRRRDVRDKVAAAVMLQGYLDAESEKER